MFQHIQLYNIKAFSMYPTTNFIRNVEFCFIILVASLYILQLENGTYLFSILLQFLHHFYVLAKWQKAKGVEHLRKLYLQKPR